MLSHSLSGSDQAAGNLAHSNEWKPSFKQLHVRSSRGCLWLALCLLLISYLSFSSFPACEYTKHKSLLFLLEKQRRVSPELRLGAWLETCFALSLPFQRGACYRPRLLAPLLQDGWVCWSSSEFTVLCVLLIIDQDSKDVSLWEVAHGKLQHRFQHTQDTPNRLCPIWEQPTSCCQPRFLEISGVQCQEDSSVLKYLSSVLST